MTKAMDTELSLGKLDAYKNSRLCEVRLLLVFGYNFYYNITIIYGNNQKLGILNKFKELYPWYAIGRNE